MRYIERVTEDNLLNKKVRGRKLKYTDNKTKKHLARIYGFKCCYCESPINSAGYFEVEHFYPRHPNSVPFNMKKTTYSRFVVNDVRNWHVACKRCNSTKGNFIGALSPNYFYDPSSGLQNGWNVSDESYISKNIWYDGAEAYFTDKYRDFFERIKINGETSKERIGIHAALYQCRVLYLEETMCFMYLLASLIQKTVNQNVNGQNANWFDTLFLFNTIRKRFAKKAPYSRMIINNCGLAYLQIVNCLIKVGCPLNSQDICKDM